MATSEAYTDIVGSMTRSWPPAYDGRIDKACPNCGAVPYEVCSSAPARPRRAPCVARR